MSEYDDGIYHAHKLDALLDTAHRKARRLGNLAHTEGSYGDCPECMRIDQEVKAERSNLSAEQFKRKK
jgi:hypothetical protein